MRLLRVPLYILLTYNNLAETRIVKERKVEYVHMSDTVLI